MKTIIDKIEVPDTVTNLQIEAVAKKLGWGVSAPIMAIDQVETRTAQEAIQEYYVSQVIRLFTNVAGEKVVSDVDVTRIAKEEEMKDLLESIKPVKP